MVARSFSSRQFNQDSSGAKKAANDGPVFITDRGKTSHVLLSVDEYLKLTRGTASIIDLVAMDDEEIVEFDPPRIEIALKLAELE